MSKGDRPLASARISTARCQHHAQARQTAGDSDALMLAKAFVFESDFDAPIDHAAIGYALLRGAAARGVPLRQHIREYVSGFKVKPGPRARWIIALREDGTKPRGWPTNLRWRPNAWLATLDRARGVLSGTLPDPCHARDWGARYGIDHERAQRAIRAGRWVVARCDGKTANAFYRARTVDAVLASAVKP